ncbi:MAG: alanine racemase, partial [Pygmaiobacter sp.]
VNIHIKVDTGMGRIGFDALDDFDAALFEIEEATHLPGLCPVGIFTHFSVSDSKRPSDIEYTKKQYALFCSTIEHLAAKGIAFPIKHCCNSAAIFMYPEMQLDLVRPGVVLYGHQPSPDVVCPGLSGALQIKAAISLVKRIRAGDDISYGRIFRAEHDMMVATLAVGYADGYQRALSDCGIVSIHGKPARVVGRVCMDQMVVDVTDIPNVRQGETAIVFGGGAADTLDDIAAKCHTINYEILCDIGRRVPRVYVRAGKPISVTDYMGEF